MDPASPQFPSFLLTVKERNLQAVSPASISLPDFIQFPRNIDNLIKSVLLNIRTRYCNELWLSQRPISTTRNSQLRMLNECLEASIPEESRSALSADTISNPKEYESRYAVELFDSNSGAAPLPDQKPFLKRGYKAMFLQNLQPGKGHMNRARYVVQSMTDTVLFLHIATDSHEENRFTLPIILCASDDNDSPIDGFHRAQSPVTVCNTLATNMSNWQ